jgi:hypothetical protein
MATAPQMVTANRLFDGAVVYYTGPKLVGEFRRRPCGPTGQRRRRARCQPGRSKGASDRRPVLFDGPSRAGLQK